MIHDFEYYNPKTVKEAVKTLDKLGDNYKIICGGQSLLIMLRQGLVQPENLVDIKGISELSYIKQDAKKGILIGALTTHRTIEQSQLLKDKCSVLVEMEHRLASVQTRNWGTIGGNLAHADPAGDPAPVLIALNATLTVTGSHGERNIPVENFFLDYFESALEHGELITEIQIPVTPAATGVVYKKFNVIETDMATVSAGVSVTLDTGNVCKNARIALGAAAPTAKRAVKAEESLIGKKVTEASLQKAGEIAATECEPISDIHASADYRRELVKVMVKRVGMEAFKKAK
jgi:carbon-monoxide dehydrogenase medium subunit